jgi:hypothetical protein
VRGDLQLRSDEERPGEHGRAEGGVGRIEGVERVVADFLGDRQGYRQVALQHCVAQRLGRG